MRVRLDEPLLLVITPETYIEQIALSVWVEQNALECSGLLIESYRNVGVVNGVLTADNEPEQQQRET